MRAFLRDQAFLVAALVFAAAIVAGMALGALRLDTLPMLAAVLLPAGAAAVAAYALIRRI